MHRKLPLLLASIMVPVCAFSFLLAIRDTILWISLPFVLGVVLGYKISEKHILVFAGLSCLSALIVGGFFFWTLTSEPHWTNGHYWMWHLWCTFSESESFVSVVLSLTSFFLIFIVSFLGSVAGTFLRGSG